MNVECTIATDKSGLVDLYKHMIAKYHLYNGQLDLSPLKLRHVKVVDFRMPTFVFELKLAWERWTPLGMRDSGLLDTASWRLMKLTHFFVAVRIEIQVSRPWYALRYDEYMEFASGECTLGHLVDTMTNIVMRTLAEHKRFEDECLAALANDRTAESPSASLS